MTKTKALTTTPRPALPAQAIEMVERAKGYAAQARAANTIRAYAVDWRDFAAWCAAQGQQAMPASPATVGVYLADLAQRARPSTISRRLVAITSAHRQAGHALDTRHPAIRDTLRGIRRQHGTAQQGKAPAVVADIRLMVATIPDTLKGARDRALILLGFAGAFRRSELVGLDAEDLQFTHDGLRVTLRRSKTDQEGEGRLVGIPYGSTPATCPVRSVMAWKDAAGLERGPLFRPMQGNGKLYAGEFRLSDRSVALLVKALAKAAGLASDKYSGHSLRAGLATSAAAAGATERAIMGQTGHRSVITVRRYIRSGELFRENAAAIVGL